MTDSKATSIPLSEMVKSIPGFLGIRLEEEPYFELLKEENGLSFRRYAPILVAQVAINAPRETALDQAFDKLAGFIYGANSEGRKFEMTTPVYMVSQTAEAFPESLGDQWTVGFVMSKDQSFEDLPHPTDEAICFRQWPSRTMAVHRYTGNNNDETLLEAVKELKASLEAAGYKPISGLIVAQYDQPFAIPFLKRNEVQVEVQMDEEMPEHSYA